MRLISSGLIDKDRQAGPPADDNDRRTLGEPSHRRIHPMTSNPTARLLANLWGRWICRALLSSSVLLHPLAARADDAPKRPPKLPSFLHLEYNRGALKDCPDQEAFEQAIIANAQRHPFNSAAPALLRVTLARRGPFHAATIEVRDADGSVLWLRPFDEPLA